MFDGPWAKELTAGSSGGISLPPNEPAAGWHICKKNITTYIFDKSKKIKIKIIQEIGSQQGDGPVRWEKGGTWAVVHDLWFAVAREGAKSQGLLANSFLFI